jgi:hypothetical protein
MTAMLTTYDDFVARVESLGLLCWGSPDPNTSLTAGLLCSPPQGRSYGEICSQALGGVGDPR